ncbi:MAG: glycine oxidase ThiO [Planctomycetes bacterium]|nr:glycine oxidase ThiO [Planctomycetota bacterium]
MDDCLIIGGGVVGLSLAWELAGCGLKVHVVERGQPGREASWAGAGILPAARRSPGGSPLEQLSALSRRLHAEWAERLSSETGIKTGFRVCGELHVARTAEAVARVEQEAREWEAADLCVERPTEAQVLKREPALAGVSGTTLQPSILSAAWLPEAAQIRNPRHLQALVLACRQRGVRLTSNAAVEDVATHDGKLKEVITTVGRFTAERFVLCAGAWTETLLARLGRPLPLKPIRGQMVLMKLPGQVLSCIVHEGPHYLVPRDDGRVLVGSTLEDVGFDKRTTDEAITELTMFAHSIVPALREAEIEQTWAGLRPGSALPNPLIGPLPNYENVLVAAGHFRWGLYLSPATAILLRQFMQGEKTEISLAEFQP